MHQVRDCIRNVSDWIDEALAGLEHPENSTSLYPAMTDKLLKMKEDLSQLETKEFRRDADSYEEAESEAEDRAEATAQLYHGARRF